MNRQTTVAENNSLLYLKKCHEIAYEKRCTFFMTRTADTFTNHPHMPLKYRSPHFLALSTAGEGHN
jgi:hypothetical protein